MKSMRLNCKGRSHNYHYTYIYLKIIPCHASVILARWTGLVVLYYQIKSYYSTIRFIIIITYSRKCHAVSGFESIEINEALVVKYFYRRELRVSLL